jgi:hypothetical protein
LIKGVKYAIIITRLYHIVFEIQTFRRRKRMKGKTIGAGAAMLLAMAFLGCSEQALDEDAPEYDEQGRRLVKVSIPTRAYEQGGARSLTTEIAQAAWDYIEVVFALDTGGYYVGSAVKGNDIHFALPVGDYEAVMFAGVGNGTRLLAVGVATDVDGTGPPAFDASTGTLTIVPDTTTITFTLSPLETDIADDSFLITEPTTPVDYASPSPIPTCTIDGKVTPYFQVPSNNNSIEGTFTIGGFSVPDADLFESSTLDQLFFMAGDATAGIDIISSGISAYNQTTNVSLAPVVVTGTITAAAISTGDLVLEFGLTTPSTPGLMEGLSKIRFDVPIQAFTLSGSGSFTPSTDRGSVWHIVNGLEAGTLDRGATEQSTGQNILLAVGVNPNGQTIVTSGP